jgi:hypothetical protein
LRASCGFDAATAASTTQITPAGGSGHRAGTHEPSRIAAGSATPVVSSTTQPARARDDVADAVPQAFHIDLAAAQLPAS